MAPATPCTGGYLFGCLCLSLGRALSGTSTVFRCDAGGSAGHRAGASKWCSSLDRVSLGWDWRAVERRLLLQPHIYSCHYLKQDGEACDSHDSETLLSGLGPADSYRLSPAPELAAEWPTKQRERFDAGVGRCWRDGGKRGEKTKRAEGMARGQEAVVGERSSSPALSLR